MDGTVFRTLYVVVEGIAFWIVFESIYTTRVRNWYAYLLAGAALLIGVSTFTPAGFVVFTIIELISADRFKLCSRGFWSICDTQGRMIINDGHIKDIK